MNYALVNQVKSVSINAAYKTDHCPVTVELEMFQDCKRGKGLWMLNTTLLEHMPCLTKVNEVIDKSMVEAELSEDDVKWEHVKGNIVHTLKKMAKECAEQIVKNFNCIKTKLEALINKRCELVHKRCLQSEQVRNEQQIQETTKKLNEHLEYKAKGARLRSKTKFYEEGELSTKYFLRLEHIKAANKTITALMREDNTIT